MNSCGAFCSTFCRAALSVFDTSVSSRAAAVACCFRCASRFFQPARRLLRTPHRPFVMCETSRRFSGRVRCAVVRWFWSSNLPLPKSSSVPHLKFMSPEMNQPTRRPLSNASESGRSLCASTTSGIESSYQAPAYPVSSRRPPGSSSARFRSANACPRRQTHLPGPVLKSGCQPRPIQNT